ncbi:MAG: DUF2336 domain-containing protein [Pseudomonadota bacterium]
MANEPGEHLSGARDGAERLLARAAAADARARARLGAVIADIFLPADARTDDRTRAAIDTTLAGLIAVVAGELREHGVRLLRARGEDAFANAFAEPEPVAARLIAAGLPRDPDFMRELIARVRQDLLAELLPVATGDDPDRPSLLPRLIDHADRVVAASAMAVLAADNRRRGEVPTGTDLPAELHHKLVWWVAAALRTPHAGRPDIAALDRALTEAALRNLGAQDEGERLEAVALRLAAALDPAPAEVAELLLEALGDRRVALFIALLAHGLGIPFDAAREIVLDPGGERLWLGCRALDLPRDAIARIGLTLAEGDAHRDLERFADELDHIAAIDVATARAAIAPLRLPPDYRAALDALRNER